MATREVIVELKLGDTQAVARLGQLEIETKAYQRELKALNAEIVKNGQATKAQQIAVGELNAKIRANQTVVRELKNDLSGATAAGLRFRDKMAEASQAGLAAFGINVIGVTAAITAGVTVMRNAVKTIKDFEQANANLASILGTSRSEITELTNSAVALAPALGRLPEEVTDLQTELAKLGFTEKQILASQEAVILLANATGEGLAKSAEVAASTIKAFGLDAEDTQRIVDVMAESFNSTSLDLEKFATAMSTVAPAAKDAGFTVEEATAMIGVLADRGLDASVAGTALRSIFIDLSKTGMSLDEALAEINGSTNKTKTAFELFGERAAGSAVILAEARVETERVTAALNDATGAGKKMADEMLDTLTGKVNSLSGAWSALVISLNTGEGKVTGVLGKITEVATGAINALSILLTKSKDLSGAEVGEGEGSWLRQRESVASFREELNKYLSDRDKMILQDGEVAKTRIMTWQTAIRADIEWAKSQGSLMELQQQWSKEVLDAVPGTEKYALGMVQLKIIAGELAKVEGDGAKATVDGAKATDGTVQANKEEGESIGDLRKKLKDLKEGFEELDVTDTAGIAKQQAAIAALEKRIKAIDGTTEATKKLTAAQLAQIDAENAIRGDARANIFAVTPTEPTEVGQAEEPIEEVTFQYDELKRLRTEFQDQQLQGIFDYNTQRALLEQEHLQGNLRANEDYQAALANLDNARLQQLLQNAQAISNIFGNLASVYDEASEEYKAFATIQTLINTYMSATAAFNALVGIPYVGPVLGGIAAAAAVAAGLANVAKIQGFEEGGYTAKRSKNTEPVGVVHANEWVAPAWQTQHPDYAPTIKWLEQARKRRGLRSNIDGFFGGGTVNNVRFARGTGLATQTGSGTIAQADLSRALLSMPPPVVSVTEIREVSNRVSVVERMSRA